MATSVQISVDEYLKTVYRPDCDYVDGAVEGRNLGEVNHATVQGRLTYLLMGAFPETGLLPLPELRMQTRPSRYRVPDIALTRGKPAERILTKPPALCIEILSPEDRTSRVNVRVREYLDFGVPLVWVVDPEEKKIWVYRSTGMEEAKDTVKLDGTAVELSFTAIFD
jgi:Uma2 family endonuclease